MLNLLHTFYNFNQFNSKLNSKLNSIINAENSQLEFELSSYFKVNKNIGSKDRKFLTEIIYFYIRNRIHINHLAQNSFAKFNILFNEIENVNFHSLSNSLLDFSIFYITLINLENESKFISELETKYHFFDFKNSIKKILNNQLNIENNEISEKIILIINNEIDDFEVTFNSLIHSGFSKNKLEQNQLEVILEIISIKYSFPIHIIKSIYNSVIEENLNLNQFKEILNILNQKASVYLREVDTNSTKNIKDEFDKNQIEISNYILKQCYVILGNANQKLTDLESFKNGQFEIQDFSSQLTFEFVKEFIIRSINNNNFNNKFNNIFNILDTCAGGGGKSLLFADEIINYYQNLDSQNLNSQKLDYQKPSKDNFHIYSSDVSSSRLDGLRERLKKSKRKRNIFPEIINISQNKSIDNYKFVDFFDLAIIDAPCSGIGTNRRDVSIKYRISESKINEFYQTQINLINETKVFLKNNGIILYITCSLNYEENIGVVHSILKNIQDLKPINIFEFCSDNIKNLIQNVLKTNFSKDTNKNFLTIFPHYFNSDGFFVALFQKTN